ncbi:adenylate/guanylate cyclase domain-containing protein [Labrenzia suaedae]|uniref:Adenylate/guanylate cyclase domain-containing protein n=1 Tax=Roseibium litorale TaxID=2803841 RepID=A0ABR9CRZ5_9HYPH|nr:adenylate/guanylate cyclase domain-containing protein [Roseibium litorale]
MKVLETGRNQEGHPGKKDADLNKVVVPKRKRRRLNIPLTRIISFGFGGFVAVALALVLFLSIKANFRNTFSLLNDKAILITQSMERELRGHFSSVEQAVTDLKPFFDNGIISLEDTSAALGQLQVALAANDQITVLVVTDLNGDNFGVYRAPNGRLWPFRRQIPSGGEKTYVLPKLTAESPPTWGPLMLNDIGQFANISVPLVRGGKKVATLTAASSLTELGTAIRSIEEGDDATIFIIANGDDVILHSDMEELQTGGKPAKSLPARRTELGDPVLAAINKGEKLSGFDKAAASGIDVSQIDVGEDDFIMMRIVVPGYSDQPWVIGQYFRGVSISREIRRLTGSAIVGVGALMIAVMIAIWMGRRVAMPLKVLAIQSRKVGSLALEDVQPLPRSRVAELDQVALAFNSMVEGLKAMNTYVPRSLFSKLMRLGGERAAQAREAELTVVFTDIVGFTALSEDMTASETARHLNEHFSILVAAVEAEGGTVDKFIGDGMLAFWGAPDARPDHAAAAVRSARRIARSLHAANLVAANTGAPVIHLRIGIHTGPAVVGNVGALDRWNYTVVGDTVNVTERLQSLGRDLGIGEEVVILASADTVSQLPGETCEQAAGDFALRGRAGALQVWKLDPFAKPETADYSLPAITAAE